MILTLRLLCDFNLNNSYQEEDSTPTNGDKTKQRGHFECYPPSKRMG